MTAGKLLSRKEVIRCSTPVTLRGGRRAKLPTGTHSRSSVVVILEHDCSRNSGSRPVNLQMDPEGAKPSGSVFFRGFSPLPLVSSQVGKSLHPEEKISLFSRGFSPLPLVSSQVGKSLHPEEREGQTSVEPRGDSSAGEIHPLARDRLLPLNTREKLPSSEIYPFFVHHRSRSWGTSVA